MATRKIRSDCVSDQLGGQTRSADGRNAEIVEFEVQARLRLLRSPSPIDRKWRETPLLPPTGKTIDKIEQIARFIGEQYQDSISIEDIGRAVDLHPKYAATLFKKHSGMTMANT